MVNKVLIVHFRNDVVSGAELAIADMVRACDQSAWDFYMLVPGPGALADFYYQEGFKVVIKRIETRRRLYPGIHSLQSLFNLVYKSRDISQFLLHPLFDTQASFSQIV